MQKETKSEVDTMDFLNFIRPDTRYGHLYDKNAFSPEVPRAGVDHYSSMYLN